MKTKKKLLVAAATVSAAAMMTFGVFANGWKQKSDGWKYSTNNEDLAWCQNGWYWVDGNNDGVAECYYFGQNGYMLSNTTTPDGYTVNSDGQWTVDGTVQTKQVTKGYVSNNLTDAAKVASTHPVTDASTIEKITLKSSVDSIMTDAYNNHHESVVDAITNKTYYDTIHGSIDIDRYTTVLDGATVYVRGNRLNGYAKDFFNNIPEQGILVKSFYDSFGYSGVSSQSREKITNSEAGVYFSPVATLTGWIPTLDTFKNNAHAYIVATKGEEVYDTQRRFCGEYYVYPDSPAVVYCDFEDNSWHTTFDTKY